VREQLEKLSSEAVFEKIEPSPQPWRYRNRIQLKYEKPALGFYARGSHQIVDIDDCLITEESLAQKIPDLKKKLQSGTKNSVAKIELLLKTSGETEMAFEDSPSEGVGFSQVNRWQNEKLISTVLEWAAQSPFEDVCDLYAGGGNFTFPLLEKFPSAKIIGVELNPKTVQLAQKTIAARSLSSKRIEFFLSDVELFLKRFSLQENSLVLLDPPRAGCSENVLKYLGHQPVSRMLYISCNPAALARDIARLQAQWRPWRVRRVKPFDMFPQTDHLETLVELTR
jgi:23S rRNA (uracil1939-C5)-methyltransferase